MHQLKPKYQDGDRAAICAEFAQIMRKHGHTRRVVQFAERKMREHLAQIPDEHLKNEVKAFNREVEAASAWCLMHLLFNDDWKTPMCDEVDSSSLPAPIKDDLKQHISDV